MSQLGELLNKLATQSGIDANDESLKALLSNPTIASYEVPEVIANGITNNLLTIESAKNNPTLKNHFFALAYNGLDSELNNLASEFELDHSIIEELQAEKSSTKRASLLTRKIKELESAKAKTNTQGKDVLQTEIDRLNAELKGIKDAHTNELTQLQAKHKDGLKDMLVSSLLNGYNYALPVDKSIAVTTAKQLIERELVNKGAKLVLNDNNELALINNEGLDFFDNNEKISFNNLVETTLANNKLLKTKEEPTPAPAPTPTPGTPGANEFLAKADELAQQFKE